MGVNSKIKREANYWLFVLTNANKAQGRYNPQVIFDVRTKQKAWGLKSTTAFKKGKNRMRPGDIVIFYVGRPYCAFAGTAELTTGFHPFSKKLQKALKDKDFRRIAKQGVKFVNFERFNIQIPVPLIADDLPFIMNKAKWETGPQGSVRKLSRKDYEQILHAVAWLNRNFKAKAEKLLRQDDVTRHVNGHDKSRRSDSPLH